MAKRRESPKKGPKAKVNGAKATTPLVKAINKVKKADKAKKELTDGRAQHGIIMLEHIPHGFYEDEIRGFFSQYGKVLRVKVARSKKTDKSKGYAYVEFEFEEVAKIAAESMNNYLMFERLVKCKLLQGPLANARKIFGDSFKGKEQLKVKEESIQPNTAEERVQFLSKRIAKLNKKNAKLQELGISYQFTPAVSSALMQYSNEIESENQRDEEMPEEKTSPKQSSRNSSNKKKNVKSPIQMESEKAVVQKLSVGGAKRSSNGVTNGSVESTTPGKKVKSPKEINEAINQGPKPKKSKGSLTPTTSEIDDPKSPNKSLESVKSPAALKSGKSPKASKGDTPKKNTNTPENKLESKNSPKTPKLNTPKSLKSPAVTPKNQKSPAVTPKNQKSLAVTPKNQKSPAVTPRNLKSPAVTPKSLKSPAVKLETKSPLASKGVLTPQSSIPANESTPKKSPKTVKKQSASKKNAVEVNIIDEIPDIAETLFPSQTPKKSKRKSDTETTQISENEKSPKIAKLTPKLQSKSPDNSELGQSIPAVSKPTEKKNKKKSLPKVSPKMLRSNKRQSEAIEVNVVAPEVITPTKKLKAKKRLSKQKAELNTVSVEVPGQKSPKAKKSESANELPGNLEVGKPSLNKFSPKALRSKAVKNELPASTPQIQITPKQEKPKFSPKLLRSKARHSDSPAVPKANVTRSTKGRKSMR